MKQTAKALIGHMQRDEALQLLSGGAPKSENELKLLEQKWQAVVAEVRKQPEYVPVDPLIPTPEEVEGPLQKFAERPDVMAVMRPHVWSVGVVDLSRSVLTYQRVVITQGVEQRVQSVRAGDWGSLLALCLPPPSTEAFQGSFDPAQNAFTAWSVNPNLRIIGFAAGNTTIPGFDEPQQLFGFRMSFGTKFIQLAEYEGRWLVRDGYHRIFGLLKLGITQIPCVIVRARTFEETGGGRPGFFNYEVMYSDRPPRIADFLSTALAPNTEVQAVTRVVRIRAEEFALPIQEPDEAP